MWCKKIGAIALGILAGWISGIVPAIALPANVFRPYLETIQQKLPPGLAVRLPTKIWLGEPADDEFIQKLLVKVETVAPLEVAVDLLSCESDQEQCWIGRFTVASSNSSIAQKDYQRHLLAANPISLNQDIRAYVLDDIPKYPSIKISSVMWQQDGLFYSAQFASPERQNMLYMAVSMANNEPVYPLNPALRLPAQTR